MAEQDVASTVAVEVAQADKLEAKVGGQAGPAENGARTVHLVVDPQAERNVAEQHIVPTVAVEVADARELERRVRGQPQRHPRRVGSDGVVGPTPIFAVAQQDLVPAVAVEVARAHEDLVMVFGQAGNLAQAPGGVVDFEVRPLASVGVAQEHFVESVPVEVADAAVGVAVDGQDGERCHRDCH